MKYKNLNDIALAKELISPPGDTLLETITHRGISQTELAMRMNRPLKTVNEIIKGKAAITPETAIQLEYVTSIPVTFWLERERIYRQELAVTSEAECLIKNKEWIGLFPLKEMVNHGWVAPNENPVDKTKAILEFFSVANQEAFDRCFLHRPTQGAFRISQNPEKNSYSMLCWLQQGEIQSHSLNVSPYNRNKLRNTLPEFKRLMVEKREGFFPLLQSLCAESGVKLVYTPCLPKAPISGATRWLNQNPLVQLTGRYHRNDIFWFTFFHEIGHVLLHDKKDFFVDDINHYNATDSKEIEANSFAIEWTFTEEEERAVICELPLSPQMITTYAKRFNTLEAIIVGRLARKEYLLHSFGWSNGFYQRISFF